ncbi:MAG: hypothetical protein GY788_31485, partial [bacterium]|nr:hypothetical protein [bacterium]
MLKSIRKPYGIASLTVAIGLLGAAIFTALPGPATTQTYIVQGASLADAKAAVAAVGGEITHELGIIRSVGARLSKTQSVLLAETDGVRRLYSDRTLDLSASSVTHSVADNFDQAAFDNNDGTQSWSGEWVEINDDGFADTGKVRLNRGRLQLKKPSRGIYRSVDLSGSTSATLNLTYRRIGLASEREYVSIDVSDDGGVSWTEVARLAGPANDAEYLTHSVDISALAGATTQLRVMTSPNMSRNPVYLNEVEIVYDSSATASNGSGSNTNGGSPDVQDSAGETAHVTGIGAHQLHAEGITGAGVGVAVIDSGLSDFSPVKRDTQGDLRTLAQYDAIAHEELSVWSAPNDGSGHATHVTSVGLSSEVAWNSGHYRGVAPDANLVAVKAFDADGQGSYADVIRAIDWVVANQDAY